MATGAHARQSGLTPLARVLAWGDAALDPIDFSVAPAEAIPKVVVGCGRSIRGNLVFWFFGGVLGKNLIWNM